MGCRSLKGVLSRALVACLFWAPPYAIQRALAGDSATDILPDSAEIVSGETLLDTHAKRRADALASFISGLFEEETAGPEKAMESYRKVLDLDPGFSELAVKVAYELLRRGESAEAIATLKDCLKASPKETAATLALSSIYLHQLHKPDLALGYANRAIEIAPSQFAPYEALWEVYFSTNQNSRATGVVDRAAKAKSDDPYFWLQVAELYSRGMPKEGMVSQADIVKVDGFLDRARAAGSRDAEVLARIGDFYMLTRQIDRAAPIYEEALDLNDTLPNLGGKLAACYIELGQIDRAIPALEKIVRENPLDLRAYDQLTEIHLKKGDFKKALANARQALLIDSGRPERYQRAVELLIETRDPANALGILDEARQKFPGAGIFSYYTAIALAQSKRNEEAVQMFERASMEAGVGGGADFLNGLFYFSYGVAAEQAGRTVKATELFKRSIELDPANSARAYNYLGYMWVERNENLPEAEQLIRRAVELDPDNGAYRDSLGWLFFKQGKYAEALGELQRAAQNLPEPDAVVFDHIGDTCEKLGKTAEAVLYWQKALKLDPDNKDMLAKADRYTEKVASQPAPAPESKPQTRAP